MAPLIPSYFHGVYRRDTDIVKENTTLRTQLAEAAGNYSTLRESLKQSDDNRLKLLNENTDLQREVEWLRERCASDPWWWAYSEYLDEGWCGPFQSREDAEANADDAVGPPRPDNDPPRCADDERPEVSFRQASNPEGCAENERLQREVERLKADIAERNRDVIGADAVTDMAALKAGYERCRTALERIAANDPHSPGWRMKVALGALAQPEPEEKTDDG